MARGIASSRPCCHSFASKDFERAEVADLAGRHDQGNVAFASRSKTKKDLDSLISC